MKRISKKVVAVPSSRYYPEIFLGKLGKTTKTSINIAGIPTDIRTEHLPNTSTRHYL